MTRNPIFTTMLAAAGVLVIVLVWPLCAAPPSESPSESPLDKLLKLHVGDRLEKPDWRPLGDLLGPATDPQPDGVVFLNLEAAAILRWNNGQAALVNSQTAGRDTVAQGRWNGENDRPTWRIALPAAGPYRVVINASTAPGEQGTAAITFFRRGWRSVKQMLEVTGQGKMRTVEMGDVDLEAGQYVVEFQPLSWISPWRFSRLADVRLIPLKPLRQQAKPEDHAGALVAVATAKTRAYPKSFFRPTDRLSPSSVQERKTLFPTGQYEQLPLQPINVRLPVVRLTLTPPPDAPQRLERFRTRNSEAALAALCRDLQKVLLPGTPGLEEFQRLYRAGRPREALEAYRAYFFDKLADPEKYGAATQNILFELTRDRGRGELLLRPQAMVLEENLHHRAVVQAGREILIGEIGPPGAASWGPWGLSLPPSAAVEGRNHQDPFWRTPDGKRAAQTIEFYRCLNTLPGDRGEYYAGGLLPALVWSYAITGNREHLALWCRYVDDWAVNVQRDQDDQPYSTRMAVELEPQFVRCMLNLLRLVLDERPELAHDFDAATLVRLLMKLNTDYAPYFIRARRAEMANWGVMGMCHQLHVSRFLHEFKAMDYFNRETWRLWNANMIQHRTLDGENTEAWDEGHNLITTEYSLDSVPYARLPSGTDRLDLIAFWDHVKTDQRSRLIHISPGGDYWPYWETQQPRGRTSLVTRYHPYPGGWQPFGLIENEAGTRQRLETILSGGHPAGASLPDRCSDIAPYAAMYYLREAWRPDADYFLMQNFRDRCQSQADCSRTMYSLSKNDRILVEAHGLVVDRKPDNRYCGHARTGGKTDFCNAAGRHVVDERFHTSARFDCAEARQDAPYARHRRQYPDPYGLYRQAVAAEDPEPVRDVTALRQVFGIRGEGVWIVSDLVESNSGKEHEFTQFFTLPLRIAKTGATSQVNALRATGTQLVQTEEARQWIRTANPGFENVSLRFFGPPLKFANVLNGKLEHETLKSSTLEMIQSALAAGRPVPMQYPVSVRWNGTGDQVLVTVLTSRPAAADPARAIDNDVREIHPMTGPAGAIGCRIVTRSGATVWFQRGRDKVNELAAGPVRGRAEALLAVQHGDETSGVVLGGQAVAIAGHQCDAKGGSLEFVLRSDGKLHGTPIYKPIDTVEISPAQTAFVDQVQVSVDIPSQDTSQLEFHYTLDGSDPTLDSPLYRGPLTLDQTTLVKVRPFRRGLAATPWTFNGTESGKTVAAIFRKRAVLPAAAPREVRPGLDYAYFEGDWPTLFTYAGFPGVLEPKTTGTVAGLLDPRELTKIRATDRAFAVRYEGFLDVPATGVYNFYAPLHLYTPTMDAGYDLRVFINGQEWFPNPCLHAEGVWSLPLEGGLHKLLISYVDYRRKPFRNDYWMAWQEEEMFNGVPVLEVSGPGLARQPLPKAWLRRSGIASSNAS